MQSIVLAINISSVDEISSSIDTLTSSVSKILACSVSCAGVSDMVIYLPKLGDISFSTLCCLAADIENSGYLGNTHFFIPDEDKEDISLDSLSKFKNYFPRFFVSSKEVSKKIGDVSFKHFNSDSLYSDELEEFFNELYSDIKKSNGDFCVVTDCEKDAIILNKISSKITVLKSDRVKTFRTRIATDSLSFKSDLVEKINLDGKISYEAKDIFYKKDIPVTCEKVMKKLLEPTTKKGKV